MNGEQLRAARAALKMDQSAFAKMCGLSVETIKRFEKIDGPIRATIDTIQKIEFAIDEAGLLLIYDESEFGDGCGIFIYAKKPERTQVAILNSLDSFLVSVVYNLDENNPEIFSRPIDEIVNTVVSELSDKKGKLEQEIKRRIEQSEELKKKMKFQLPDKLA